MGPAPPGVGGSGEGRRRVTGKGRHACLPAFLVLLAGTWIGSASSLEAAPSPAPRARLMVEVSGPVQGGAGQATPARPDLPSLGYTESEFFFGGTATAYSGARKPSGVWNARSAAERGLPFPDDRAPPPGLRRGSAAPWSSSGST